MNRDQIRVLVTAVGGDLGQALVKSLRLSEDDFEIFGCDADPASIGGAFVSSFESVPAAYDPMAYLSAMEGLCGRHRIDAVVPASEVEIFALAKCGRRLPCG